MSLIEGEANGLPLISYDVLTGPNEIISNGKNGYLIDSGNSEEMCQHILYLMNNPELREKMSNCSLQMVKNFAIDSIIEKWKCMIYE